MLEKLGAWNESWTKPACDPVEYLDRLGYLVPGCLVVHGVHLSDEALARLRERRAVLVTCPRSNVWVGAGSPPAARFYGAGVPVAIGTDSLASAPTLNLFDELAELHRIAPGVAPSRLLDSATRVGAGRSGWSRASTRSPQESAPTSLPSPSRRASSMWKNTWSVEPGSIQWVNG
jgi:cytosine/adenosine deaminase-related metal-dependent hydrolase